MNTLQTNSPSKDLPGFQSNPLHSYFCCWDDLQEGIRRLSSSTEPAPVQIEGVHGSMVSFLLAEYLASTACGGSCCVMVVSGEREAQELALDLSAAHKGIQVRYMPWWGMVPYRPAPRGAAVFGQRAATLASLASMGGQDASDGEHPPTVFIVSQRSLQTPVPPPEYIRSLLFSLQVGDSFDPVALAGRLVEQGYLRVPRVTVRGEFALRGEVLDIFMAGEEVAHRIVFDFDQIEQIKTFDPEGQQSLETVDSLRVYPMK